jgi:hypothetical protein
MHLGQVFSDEESTTDYDSDFDDLKSYDSRHADTSEDERDYEIWRKYNKQ